MNTKLKEIIRKNKLIPILTIILFITIISINSISAAEITNTTLGGINQAVNDANANDIIYLENGIYNKYNDTDKDYNITITKNLTFIGNGSNVIIDAQGKDRIFIIPGGSYFVTANFINITFINGLSNQGSVFYNGNSQNSLNFNNCTFINNSATQLNGGAIDCAGNLSIINSKFINNTAENMGGAIHHESNGDSTILFNVEDSYFENNHAGSHGGAILTWSNNLMIKNSIFINNSASSLDYVLLGGAIGSFMAKGTVDNCSFENNSADRGGAIYGAEKVINSYFNNNNAENGSAIYASKIVNGSTFINNHASFGGAIYIPTSTGSSINYNRFYNNSGYDLYNLDATNVNADYNWWGYNDIDNLLFNVTTSNHYVLAIVNDSSLDGVVYNDNLLFYFLVLNTTNDSSDVENLPDFNVTGDFNTLPFNTTQNSLFSHNFLMANAGLQTLKIKLDGEEKELSFNALKGNLTINATFEDGVYGENVTVTLKLNDSVNLTSNVSIGNQNFTNVQFINGIASINYTIDRAGAYSLIIFFNGTDNYNNCSNITSVSFDKRQLNITAIIVGGVYGENVTVSLVLNDSVNVTSNVSIGGQNFTNVRFVDGIASVNYSVDRAGVYDLTVKFMETDNYSNCSNQTAVDFAKRQLNITATIPKGVYGENVTVTLELNEAVDVVSNVSIGGQNFTNIHFVGGVASVNYTITRAGEYNLNIFFNGTNNYNNCSNITRVSFDKRQLNITAIIVGGVYGNNVTAILVLNESVNITSNVTIGSQEFIDVRFVNGNSSVNYTVNRAGEYGLIVKFMETDNYSNCSNETFVNFAKKQLNINATIPRGVFGDNVTVDLELNEAIDVMSNLTIGSQNFTNVRFIGGLASVNYTITRAGNYNLNIFFNGSSNYNNCSNVTAVSFDKRQLNITAIIIGGVYGENITTILVLNETVNITSNVTIGNQNFINVRFINGNASVNYTVDRAGEYGLIVKFGETDNYSNCSNETFVNFAKKQLNITATIPKGIFGDNVTVSLELNEAIDVVNNISIGDQNFINVNFVGGLASVNYTITRAGNYNLNIFFNGSNNYNNCSNITAVSFDKRQLNITAIIIGGIYGENITAILVLNESVNITSNVSIGSQEFIDVRFVNGNGSVNYSVDRAGEYGLIVKFSGTENYSNCSNETFVNFAKRQLNINATIPRGVYGENVTVSLKLNEDINVVSNLTIGSQNFSNVRFIGGLASVNYTITRAGDYDLNIFFKGSDNYNNCSNISSVSFDKRSLNISAHIPNGAYGNNVTVSLKLNETVDVVSNISIGNQNFSNVQFTNGMSSVNYNIDRMGEYTLTIIFYGNENYNNCSNITDVNFNMKALNITAIVPNGTYGDTININLTLSESINIISNVTIGNDKFLDVYFTNGKAIIAYKINNAYIGNLRIVFDGNENYTSSLYETTVNFAKKSLNISASIPNGIYGDNLNISLELNESVNVTSNISIGNQKFNNVQFMNGKSNVNYFINRAGSYSLNIQFNGTENYNPCSNILDVDFAKRSLNISASIPNGAYGDTVKVNLRLNETVNIISNLTIGNQKFTDVKFVNGMASVDYIIDTVYSGDLAIVFDGNENYTDCENKTLVNFAKKSLNISASIPSGVYGDNLAVALELNESVNVVSNVSIGNQKFTNVEFVNGKANVNYIVDRVGSYSLIVKFDGSEYYNSCSNLTAVDFTKKSLNISASIGDGVYGDTVKVNLSLNEAVNTKSNVIVGNQKFNDVDFVNGMASVDYIVDSVYSGDLAIVFEGNENYSNDSSFAFADFLKADSNVVVNFNPNGSRYGDSVVLNATVLDNNGNPLDDVKLVFYINNMSVGYNYTNIEGIAILDYLVDFIGDYNLSVVFEGNENYTNSSNSVSGEFKEEYTKSNSTIIINSNNNGSKYNEDIIFNATVLDENDNPLDNVVVEFYINNNLIGYNTTNTNGIAILNFNVNFTGKYQLNIVFNGDENYNGNSSSVSGEFIKTNAIINVNTIPKNIDIGSKLTIKGNITDKDGKLLNGKYNLKIKVTNGKYYVYGVEVMDGLWNLTINNPKLATTNIEISLDNNPNYKLKETKKLKYNVVKIKTTITISAPKITLGKKTNIVVTLKDHNGKAIKGKKITITSKYLKKPFTATTNSKGQIAIRIYISKAGKYTGIAKFTGDSTYLKSQKT
ncbi:MAG: hypothetical protein LBM96_00905, partial [Methanobrevibacter sp.]|nr:hypothetical protein [Candidatus Methanoflexus mossambicus]